MRLVHPNGQWQSLVVADLRAGGVWTFREAATGVRIIYSDPPWNPGNEKWWRRHAGVEPPPDYAGLLDAWCTDVTHHTIEHVFCEQSVNPRHRQLFLDAVTRCPSWRLPLLEEWTVYYGSPGSRSCTRPNTLLHFGQRRLRTDPSGLSGEAMTSCVFEGLIYPTGTIVGDPCMGKGMTSRLAHAAGWCCVGTELNERRLDYAVRWLTRQGYVMQ